ncbi:unnamed protein product [Calypogeia fissa]
MQQQKGNGVPTFKLEPAKKQLLQERQRRVRKWSRGDAPGEYGGPPLDTRIRTSWGGNSTVDPLSDSGDYIWKKNWQPFVESPPSDAADVGLTVAANTKELDSGFLSLNRAIALDSMDVDLTQELMKPSKATLQRQVEEARRADLAARKNEPAKLRWRLAPTRREEELWAKGRKAATGGSEVMAREVNQAQIDPIVEKERQRLWYLELKRRLQLLTLAIGCLGTGCAYFTYSPEIAGSYGVGLLGALLYVRLLGNSVDGLGSSSSAGAARQAMGSPRLMVPVVLVMVYNRWNALLVPELSVMPLDLIPMLLGFFTYKAATLVETFKELLPAKEEKDFS